MRVPSSELKDAPCECPVELAIARRFDRAIRRYFMFFAVAAAFVFLNWQPQMVFLLAMLLAPMAGLLAWKSVTLRRYRAAQ